jgi:hypothetical protein
LRRGRLHRQPGHRAERVQVGGGEDVADLAQRRVAHLGVGFDAQQSAQVLRLLVGDEQQHQAVDVALDGHGHPGDVRLRIAAHLHRLPRRQRQRPGDVDRHLARQHLRQGGGRGAGGDVGQLAQGVKLDFGQGRVHGLS